MFSSAQALARRAPARPQAQAVDRLGPPGGAPVLPLVARPRHRLRRRQQFLCPRSGPGHQGPGNPHQPIPARCQSLRPSMPWKKRHDTIQLMSARPCGRQRRSRSLMIWRHGSRCNCQRFPASRTSQQPFAMRSVACQRRGHISKAASWSWTTISASPRSDR